MKKIVSLSVLLLLIALVISGCTRVGSSMNGSGKIMDTNLDLEGFDSLNIKGPFIVEVTQAAAYKVVLSVDDNLVNRVKISLEHKTLNLGVEAPATFFPTSLKLKVEMPVLVSLSLSDEANATVNGFKDTETFYVFLSGKSTLKSSAQVQTLELNISGAATATFQGGAHLTRLEARGGSKIDLLEFESAIAQVKMTEASEAAMKVNGPVDITLDKNSKFLYTGFPVFRNTAISGGSTMAPK
jgi:hypothetical protein